MQARTLKNFSLHFIDIMLKQGLGTMLSNCSVSWSLVCARHHRRSGICATRSIFTCVGNAVTHRPRKVQVDLTAGVSPPGEALAERQAKGCAIILSLR